MEWGTVSTMQSCWQSILPFRIIRSYSVCMLLWQLTMSQLDPSLQETTYQQMQAFWQTPSYHFYMAGVERMAAIVLQICLSVLVYKCVKTGQKKFIAGAVLLHFIVDFVTVVTAGFGMPIWAVEIEIIVIVAIIVWGVARIYKHCI